MQVRENSQMQFSFIAHNVFVFDMFFLLKGIRISVWQTQDFNIGGSGYRTSILLASAHKLNLLTPWNTTQSAKESSPALSKELKKLAIQFLNQRNYFSQIWQRQCNYEDKRKVPDIIVSRKGVIPYAKIKTIDSLSLRLENGIFYTRWI